MQKWSEKDTQPERKRGRSGREIFHNKISHT